MPFRLIQAYIRFEFLLVHTNNHNYLLILPLNELLYVVFIILFLYRYYLCYFTEDIEKALYDTLELNSMFRHPLSEKEVTRATKSAEKVYKE